MKNLFKKVPADYVVHSEDINNIEVALDQCGFETEEMPGIIERHLAEIKKRLWRGANPIDVGKIIAIKEGPVYMPL